MPKAKTKRKVKPTRWEVILLWRAGLKPFVHQKLSFLAPNNFTKAYREVRRIRRLLIHVGNLDSKDVKIIAFGLEHALEQCQEEHAIRLRKNEKVMKQLIKKAVNIQMNTKPKLASKKKDGITVIRMR